MNNILPFGWTVQAAAADTNIQALVSRPNPEMLAALAIVVAKSIAAHRIKKAACDKIGKPYPFVCYEESQAFAHEFANQWQPMRPLFRRNY